MEQAQNIATLINLQCKEDFMGETWTPSLRISLALLDFSLLRGEDISFPQHTCEQAPALGVDFV